MAKIKKAFFSTGWLTYLICGIILAWLVTKSKFFNNADLASFPEDVTDNILSSQEIQEFDFVVVGSGPAGSVVARRLSEEAGWKVLIIEAGGDPTPETKVPGMFLLTQRTRVDWNYTTEPNENYCRGYKEGKCRWTRGKTIGGSGAVNAMIYLRGNEADFDEWESLGNEGWGYKSILKYFKKLETAGQTPSQNLENMGLGSVWKDTIMNGWKELGFETNIDLYQPRPIGIAEVFGTVKGGERFTPADSYLRGAGENLKMMKNSMVTKIDIDDQNAVRGINLKTNGKNIYIKIKNELVLSSGAINTPQLLMLSGIGPKQHLESMGIPTKQNLPVGGNLQDHNLIPLIASSAKISRGIGVLELAKLYIQYKFFRTGLFSTVGLQDLVGFLNTRDKESTVPNIQLMHSHGHKNSYYYILDAIKSIGFDDETVQWMYDINMKSDIAVFGVVLLKPESKGHVKLRSLNPEDALLITPNYYQEEEDMEVILEGINFVEKLENTTQFREQEIVINLPTRQECASFEKRSKDYWRCYVKYLGGTVYHPIGTAKMGPDSDPEAVVDPELRVRGIKGLRVADASIMPSIVRANPMGAVLMIGEIAADKIKTSWL